MWNMFILTCLMVAATCVCADDVHLTDEVRLTKHLLKKYEKVGTMGRPVAKDSDPWNVTFHLTLQNILDVDADSDTIDLVTWHYLNWQDFYLNWDKKDYNVDNVRVKPYNVMIPDVVPYTAVSKAESVTPADVLVYQGGAMLIQPMRQRFSCPISGRREFTCDLKFGSWSFSDDKLKLKLGMDHVDLDYYQRNKHYKVVKTAAVRNVKHFPGVPDAYVDLTFSITLRKEDDNKIRNIHNHL